MNTIYIANKSSTLIWGKAYAGEMQEHLFEDSTSKNHWYFIWDSNIVHNGNIVIQV
jgi:hypothetical protein